MLTMVSEYSGTDEKCGEEFREMVRNTQEPDEVEESCPECGSEGLHMYSGNNGENQVFLVLGVQQEQPEYSYKLEECIQEECNWFRVEIDGKLNPEYLNIPFDEN